MTILTHGSGLDVGDTFASGGNAVMAIGAAGGSTVVVKGGRGPAIGSMAVITTVATGHMSDWFPQGGTAVVAGGAATQYCSMIHTGDR
jgi:hypothetical protein